MHVRQVTRRRLTIAVTAIAAAGALAATASAVWTPSHGTTQTRMSNLAQTELSSTNSTTWVPVPGSVVDMFLTESELINARFTAESGCRGSELGSCSVRIVAYSAATGAITELQPASGMNFTFDSTNHGGNDLQASHAMERSLRLPAGHYRFGVQHAVSSSSISSSLDDWHFAVEASA